jgi:hypothetical protein
MDYLPGGDPGDKKNYFVQNMRPGLTYYELGFQPINGERKRKFIDAGDPKSLGPVLYYKLAKEPQEITIEILDKDGNVIRNYNKEVMALNYGSDGNFNSGLNKFVWDMRINRVTSVKVFMNPKESYTQAQAEAKYAFWMELYNAAESSTQNVIAALKIKEEIASKIEAFKIKGASSGKIKKAERQAEVIAALVSNYEARYVSTGRTLAEVINLPATILFKMSFMSGILDGSEGPVTQSMKTEFEQLIEDSKAVDEKYNADIKIELSRFDKVLN